MHLRLVTAIHLVHLRLGRLSVGRQTPWAGDDGYSDAQGFRHPAPQPERQRVRMVDLALAEGVKRQQRHSRLHGEAHEAEAFLAVALFLAMVRVDLLPDASRAKGNGVALAQPAGWRGRRRARRAAAAARAVWARRKAPSRLVRGRARVRVRVRARVRVSSMGHEEKDSGACVPQPKVTKRRIVAEAEHAEAHGHHRKGAVRRTAAQALQRRRGQAGGIVEDHLARQTEGLEHQPAESRGGHTMRRGVRSGTQECGGRRRCQAACRLETENRARAALHTASRPRDRARATGVPTRRRGPSRGT
eukprot:scaffold58625_cov59-Phaeocystis_antarctica.AAC.2